MPLSEIYSEDARVEVADLYRFAAGNLTLVPHDSGSAINSLNTDIVTRVSQLQDY